MEKAPCIVFRINEESGSGPDLVREVFLERGWVEFDESIQDENDWNLWWRASRFRQIDYENLQPWQRLNHHPVPKSNAITSKDGLLRQMRRMRIAHGRIAHFSLMAYHLPREERQFKDEFMKNRESQDRAHNVWIYKPTDQSRGRGIFVFNELRDLRYCYKAVVQHYLPNPYLISGYKFDLRLYVIVVSFHPLIVYLCNEGLVRFSTEKYDLSALDNVYSHLTNTSINKYGPSYADEKVGVGAGCKWTFAALRSHFYGKGIFDRYLWSQIVAIVILTLAGQAAEVPRSNNCFELYGFDIIIDEDLKPWLLEVNFGPALTYDCVTDSLVKKSMLNSLCDMLGFSNDDGRRGRSSSNEIDSGFSSAASSHFRHSSTPLSRPMSTLLTRRRRYQSQELRRYRSSQELASTKVSVNFSQRFFRANRASKLRGLINQSSLPATTTHTYFPDLFNNSQNSHKPNQFERHSHLTSPSSSESENEEEDSRYSIVGMAARRKQEQAAARSAAGGEFYGAVNHRNTFKNSPKDFGDFKLVFPFNNNTRSLMYSLEERKIVAEVRRWLAHRLKETRERTLRPDPNCWDLLDIWEPLQGFSSSN